MITAPTRCRTSASITCAGCLALLAPVAAGHVQLDAPNGGESYAVGAVAAIEWHVQISHNTANWDLEYSTQSADGPWLEIATDLPAGDTSGGAPHSFDWTVPDAIAGAVWVRVRQDNEGQDYYDESDEPFTIAAACPADIDGPDGDSDGNIDALDMLLLVAQWGTPGPEADITGPADAPDGIVDSLDLLDLLAQWGTPASCPMP